MTFDGSREGLNVERFSYRLESNASTSKVPQYQLLTDIQFALKGKALTWYWAFRESKHPKSWIELREAMKRRFQDSSTDFDIRLTITECKQRDNENF